MRAVTRTIGVLLLLVMVAMLGVYALGVSGIGTERLRIEAEAALRRAVGPGMTTSIGPAQISLDSSRFIALQLSDVAIKADGMSVVDAGQVRFGVRFLPLLSGNLRLGSASISDARIVAGPLRVKQDSDWTQALRNEQGLLDPDLAGAALFQAIRQAFAAVQLGETQEVELRNIEVLFAQGEGVGSLLISQALLTDMGEGRLEIAADLTVNGRGVAMTGGARRDAFSGRISDLAIKVAMPAPEGMTLAVSDPLSEKAQLRVGAVDLALAGEEGVGSAPSRLTAAATIGQVVVDLGRRGAVNGEVVLDATLETGANKIEFDRLRFTVGRSVLTFSGAVGPKPPGAQTEKPVYRYEFVSNDSTMAPADSPEPAMHLRTRMAGYFDEAEKRLVADQLAIDTGQGAMTGNGAAQFVAGKTPGLSFAMHADGMPVSHVKQLWPWIAAGKAREWALQNFFGGTVVDSHVTYQVEPGRIGNGVPVTPEEVSGRFQVRESRFDTTGTLPPIRDADGVVEFRGNNVDVSLSKGSMFMPSGRSVAVSNGKLTIRDAHLPPVIGALDIDIAGDAAAVTELASFEPINAMRRIGLSPDDFSGKISGNVKSDIPFQKGVDLKTLDWLVTLDYSDLSIAKPLDGQTITAAAGTIMVDPKEVIIDAKAKVNGVAADLRVVEPLTADGPARLRKAELALNDRTRDMIAPGLDTILSGPFKLTMTSGGKDSPQQIVADLSGATLDIPWAGWSKGPGIAAKVSFSMSKSGKVSKLSDFKLTGPSFAVSGALSLSDGGLASAAFDRVQLNRGDDVRVAIARAGKGYKVTIDGDSFDARAMIKRFISDTDTATKSVDGGTVTVAANVDRLLGFHDESLSNVRLDYSGAGSRTLNFTVSAVTRSGGAVSIRTGIQAKRSTMQMQSADAGAVVRFLNIYEHMQGGAIRLSLAGPEDGPMTGQVDATNFVIVDEPRMGSLVSSRPPGSDSSLNEAVKRDIDTSKVNFERGYAAIEKGTGYLNLATGVLRGPLIGATFQGTLYDKRSNMEMTGTFMPAYGLNRLFGELPLIGVLLGNGRDRGLIGVTFKLSGKASSPNLQINPLSVIAPGIFRQIFEFR